MEYIELIHNAILSCDAMVLSDNGQTYVYAYVNTISIAEKDNALAKQWYDSEYKDGYYIYMSDEGNEEYTRYLSSDEMETFENAYGDLIPSHS